MNGAKQIHTIRRGESLRVAADFGENTAGLLTGPLAPGDTVSSATVSVHSKPSGAADFTIGSASVNGSTEYINDRSCSAGEAIVFRVTAAADQAYGEYSLLLTATTAGSDTIKRTITLICEPL